MGLFKFNFLPDNQHLASRLKKLIIKVLVVYQYLMLNYPISAKGVKKKIFKLALTEFFWLNL